MHFGRARHASEDIGRHHHPDLLVVVLQGGQQLVGNDLAALAGIGPLDPDMTHLPAALHVGIEHVEELIGFIDDVIGHLDRIDLVLEENFKYHEQTCLQKESDMLLRIKGLIPSDQLAIIREILDRSDYQDGRRSAGREAVGVKHNEELAPDSPDTTRLNNIVMGRLVAHPTYRYGVLPSRIAAPFYARYTAGKRYGDHIDDPIMGIGDRYRTDVSITVFLNGPEEYEGGELSISTTYGTVREKLPAGDAVMYPSGSLHHVAEVTRGVRLVAVTWAQSMIRDPARRELLYNLGQARDELIRTKPEDPTTLKVSTSYINLIRMWAEI